VLQFVSVSIFITLWETKNAVEQFYFCSRFKENDTVLDVDGMTDETFRKAWNNNYLFSPFNVAGVRLSPFGTSANKTKKSKTTPLTGCEGL
jgi:hypothetical protein